MSLASKYRAHYGVQRSDRLILYVVAATAFHLGALTAAWSSWQESQRQAELAKSTQPIEFIYLDSAENQPTQAQRHASNAARAAGENQPNLPVNAGKSVKEADPKAIAMTDSPKPTLTPASAPAHLSRATPPEPKALEAQPAPESDEKPLTLPAPLPALSPLPLPTPLPSLSPIPIPIPIPIPPPQAIVPEPVPLPSPAPSVSPRSDPALAPSIPAAPVVEPGAIPIPVAMGQGLDGLTNPDQTAVGLPSVAAESDRIWGPYTDELNRRIHQVWQPYETGTPYRVQVRFTLNQMGHLVGAVQVSQSSGVAIADQTAIQAVQASAPFNPLPAEAQQDQVTVRITFNYSVQTEAPNSF